MIFVIFIVSFTLLGLLFVINKKIESDFINFCKRKVVPTLPENVTQIDII